MKKINLLIIAFLAVLVYGCIDPEDPMTGNAQEGGALLEVSRTEGKFLGNKSTENDTLASFTETLLDFNVRIYTGGEDGSVDFYELVKKYNGGEAVPVTTFTSEDIAFDKSFTYQITSPEEFVEGTTASLDGIKVGDVFSFVVMIHMKDGRVLESRGGKYDVTANCASNLAGTYTLSGTWTDGDPYEYTDVVVTEIGPGQYTVSRTGHWSSPILPGDKDAPLLLNDQCGNLFIPQHNLGDYYSNQVYGIEDENLYGQAGINGKVSFDADGNVTKIDYSYFIDYRGGQTYNDVLTPVN
ncbi:hypothetical protein OO013_13815 [Mangrovivirga sp. M17]|uniref:Uncharacterized protein n=1 Tax=Mangrovivirga halotolerans TaxID=2993936 RepID=A0ABT3RUC3_9BACT|nr:hypothetical protein [Mangrovivirga halotolerans]MCX2744954.1 hypothetical protein [Mangrovivirga halotolerans]